MSYSNWSANKSITGGALIAKLTIDNNVLFSFFKQTANNPDKKGNFDFKNPINIKLSPDEVADIVRAIRVNGESKLYHKFENNVTTASFRYYSIAAEGEKPARTGFGFSVTKGETTVKTGFSLGAAEHFSEYLKFVLNKLFEAGFIEDLSKDKEYINNKKKENKAAEKVKESEKVEDNSGADF